MFSFNRNMKSKWLVKCSNYTIENNYTAINISIIIKRRERLEVREREKTRNKRGKRKLENKGERKNYN